LNNATVNRMIGISTQLVTHHLELTLVICYREKQTKN